MKNLNTFYSIQYLRFIAATMVVLVHISHTLSEHLKSATAAMFDPGATGVDIFFVISGFIMYAITRRGTRGPGEFFLLRFTRIAPPYWIITTVMLAAVLARPDLFYASSFDAAHTIASYLFIPWKHPDADIQPLLHVGWTLNLEFLFYSIVALTLFPVIPAAMRLWLAIGVMIALTIAGYVFTPTNPILVVWTSSVMMEFAFGMIVAWAYFRGLRLPVWLSLGMILAGFALLLQVTEVGGVYDRSRWLNAGLPSTLIVWGALELEKAGRVPGVGWLKFLGDISFALYLCHYFAIGFIRALWPRDMIGGISNDILFYVAALALSFAGSALFYLLVEKPLINVAQSLVKSLSRGGSGTSDSAPAPSK